MEELDKLKKEILKLKKQRYILLIYVIISIIIMIYNHV